jgi:hypothetical protein
VVQVKALLENILQQKYFNMPEWHLSFSFYTPIDLSAGKQVLHVYNISLVLYLLNTH